MPYKSKKPRQRSRGGKRKQAGSNSFSAYKRMLVRKYGAYHTKSSNGMTQLVAVYNGQIPPRMPSPQGPTRGANLSTTQFVRGSDMTLPTGSAIVGALLRQSSATDVFASWAFCLADIPNISSLGALFDQYRIDAIQFRLRTRNPAVVVMNSASPNYATTSPLLVVDRDDNTAPSTLLELQQYDNCTCISTQDSIDILLDSPSITPSVFSGGAFSGYAVDDSGNYWLDVANTSIPHYGIKAGLPALVASTTSKIDWDVEAWYKVSFRNIR